MRVDSVCELSCEKVSTEQSRIFIEKEKTYAGHCGRLCESRPRGIREDGVKRDVRLRS
jgi:hypothetical protein